MVYKVEVYIYDLSRGMARTLGPAIIGRPLDGIWHTAVVVFGEEYFYGAGGIVSCPPGTTMLGAPMRIEDLGTTQITADIFQDYLRTHAQDRYHGTRYDLFHHNCNTFSHETAQFLTGNGIPQYILDLPRDVLSTPMGQMLAPMIQQMTPSGTAIPFMGQPVLASDHVSSLTVSQSNGDTSTEMSASTALVYKPVVFNKEIKNLEGLSSKLETFNTEYTAEEKLTESELKIVSGIARGLVRLTDEHLGVLLKMLKWKEEHRFPALDLLRLKASRPASLQQSQQRTVCQIFQENLSASSQVNAILCLSGLSNLLADPATAQLVELEPVLNTITASILPTSNPKVETSIAAFLLNASLYKQKSNNLDELILFTSSLLSEVIPAVNQEESKHQLLSSLSTLLSTSHQEVKDLALSMEIHAVLRQHQHLEQCRPVIADIQTKLKTKSDGIDLD